MKHFKRLSIISLIAIWGLLPLFSCAQHNQETKDVQEAIKDTIKQTPPEEVIYTVIGVGDIMMGTNYPNAGYLPPNDGRDILKPVAAILADADITFGNHEGTLLNSGGQVKSCKNPDICYAFRSPEHYAGYLVEAGFDMLSIANNHTGDFGAEGRSNTKRTLEKYGLAYAGLVTDPTAIVEKNGKKYGLVAFAPNSGTLSIKDVDNAVRIVKELKEKVDFVIVSFHGGAEGPQYQNVPRKKEIFLGEDRGDVYNFAHSVIDAGADIVFGHGPHVTRAIEVYNNKFIAYSLGNFCTYGRFNIKGESGLAPIIKVYINEKGEFQKAHITPVKLIGRGEPVPDDAKGALKTIQRLSRQDFPESPVTINNDGWVEYLKDAPLNTKE